MSVRDQLEFFEQRRNDPGGLVLASVYETLGSTYSKTGDRMLIAANGDFQGMLSGGCLEGDLAERASRVAQTKQCERVTYDLRSGDDDLWGLGVGCEGLMRIFLQPLGGEPRFEPFASIAGILRGDVAGVVATVLESTQPACPPGAALTGSAGEFINSGIPAPVCAAVESVAASALADRESRIVVLPDSDGEVTVLCAILRPPPRVLVLGGGPDVQPLLEILADLGWRVTVQDHRPAYIEKGDFDRAEQVLCLPVADIASAFKSRHFDAAVVMSHHLETDRRYLEWLSTRSLRYVGLLGPIDRRRRLLGELGEVGDTLKPIVHGPAGLDLGGRGPEAIALSIAAEMHQVLVA